MTAEAGWLLAILDRMGPKERGMLLEWLRCVEPAIWDPYNNDYNPEWVRELLDMLDGDGDA